MIRRPHRNSPLGFPRVLVTGGTGLLGQPLVERLGWLGYHVTILARRPATARIMASAGDVVWGDLADESLVKTLLNPWRWDAVVNLAGPVPKHETVLPEDYPVLSQHVKISLHLCLAIPAQWTGRFIQISGMNVYGSPAYLPVDERHPCRPVNVYGAAKMLSEDLLWSWAQKINLDCWILRLAGLFTETRRAGAIYTFLRAALEHHPLVISAARPTPWDVLHVNDAVEAIACALASEARSPGPVNISYGEPVELTMMAERIVALAGTTSEVQRLHNVVHPVFQLDVTKARRLLDWHPGGLQARLEAMCKAVESEKSCGVTIR